MSPLFIQKGEDLLDLAEEELTESAGIQKWLASHPKLLAGSEIDPSDPRRFLLVRREVPVAGLFLDHLFLDQDATPTFVETKKATNRESRRVVVAQMLDYASEAAGSWSAQGLEQWFYERCQKEGLGPNEVFSEFGPEVEDAQAFWARAEEKLRAGDVRLMFVADEIPPSLQRIVEFLNERMKPTVVLAVEVRRHQAEGIELFESSLVGQTERARDIKGTGTKRPQAIRALIETGTLAEGAELWLLRNVLPVDARPEADDDPRLRFTLKLDGGRPLLHREAAGGEAEDLIPSKTPDRVRQLLDPSFTTPRARAVNDAFALEPGGASLGALAVEKGVWSEE